MGKLLFLLTCALLLLLASATPALADFYYQVSPYDGSVLWADEATQTWGTVRTIPSGADVRVGLSLVAMNHGGAMSQSEAFLFRLEVTKRGSSTPLRAPVDESTCGSFWGAPYPYNDWMVDYPDFVLYPYNPSVGAEATARDWLVPMGSLTSGRYTISYSEKLTRPIVDPLFLPPSEGPGKKGPWDWTDYEATFVVK
jgi:hypothetical protein